MLTSLDRDLWAADHPLKIGGFLQIGTRMCVVRLSDGGLLLHSPIPIDETLRAELAELGPVRCIAAPNLLHYFFVNEWKQAYPEARVFAAPGLADKQKSLSVDEELGSEPPAAWKGDLEQTFVEGAPKINEVVFFHPASRTLLLTDLSFHIRQASGASRLFWRINQVYQRFGPSRMARSMMRDKAAVRRGIDRILDWDFERVTVTHGEILEKGGREALRESFAWLGAG